MSARARESASERREPTVSDRIDERPAFSLAKVRKVSTRALAYRFIAGAVTSVLAGGVTIAFGARAGGIMLGFPAILAASLTLIEQQEDSEEAREDARGAILGGLGMAAFAGVVALTLPSMAGALALLLATAAWFSVVLVGYAIMWL